MNIKEAKVIAFGSREAKDLDEYYDAWQWLYDNEVELKAADELFMDKLICDGNVIPREGYFD
jgi:hypothetical protein